MPIDPEEYAQAVQRLREIRPAVEIQDLALQALALVEINLGMRTGSLSAAVAKAQMSTLLDDVVTIEDAAFLFSHAATFAAMALETLGQVTGQDSGALIGHFRQRIMGPSPW